MVGIFTNDDAGASADPEAVARFETVAGWLDSLGVPGTFFWVPKPGNFQRAHEVWRDTLKAACDSGHDFQLHGLTHGTCLEFGLPQESTRRANPRPFDEYEANREHWQQEHSVEALSGKIQQGAQMYGDVFGEAPRVFRAPCFGVCANMYEALAGSGIMFSSSRGINPTATAYTITGDESLRRWAPDFPCKPWTEPGGVVEMPCTEDLLIGGLSAEQVEDRYELMTSELGHMLDELDEDGALVFGTHYSAMARHWELIQPLMQRVLEWLGGRGVTRWVTFRQYVEGLG